MEKNSRTFLGNARTITDANAKTPINQRKTKDTKRGRTGRTQTNTSTINKPDDGSNRDPTKGYRTDITANKQTLKKQREPCKM